MRAPLVEESRCKIKFLSITLLIEFVLKPQKIFLFLWRYQLFGFVPF